MPSSHGGTSRTRAMQPSRGAWALLCCAAAAWAQGPPTVPERIRLEVGGALVGELRFAGERQPVVYPLLAPGGMAVTRTFPFGEQAGEPTDHPHHRSLWFAHGDVNGVDFWADGERAGRIECFEILAHEQTADQALVRWRDRWIDAGGVVVCEDQRWLRIRAGKDATIVDYDITLQASAGEVRFGDTKEGTLALRLRPELALRGAGAKGHCVNSEGVRGAAVWGKRAAWVEYSAEVDGALLGIAVFDHPSNFAHPTWWHARDYGLVAANPFGVHDFEGKPKGTGDKVLVAGESLVLRYRLLLHHAAEVRPDIAAGFAAWVKDQRGG